MKKQIEIAYKIAKKAHKGQIDRAGVDYIKHPETVANFVTTDEEKIVAYLHDVIEDTNVTLKELKTYGFSEVILEAIDIITKKKGQTYQNYLELVKTNELARIVKLADLRHNSDLSRLKEINPIDIKRREKYLSAIKFLST